MPKKMSKKCMGEDCNYYEDGQCKWEGDQDSIKTVAVDLDGTIVDYEEWNGEEQFGEVKEGAKEELERLQDLGYFIIIYTCRKSTEKIREFLKEKDIPFSWINENPAQCPAIDKVLADHYIDDRAIAFRGDWKEITQKVIGRDCSA